MSPPRPEINATIKLCSRTLTKDQTAAVQAANREPFQLTHAKSKKAIQNWADDLELEILIAFNVDPSRYKIHLHEAAPPHRLCPEQWEVRALNYADLSGKENQVVDGTFELHFVLRDNVSSPTLAELQQWQERWKTIVADPPPPHETIFSPCNFRGPTSKIDAASLARPPKGDVEATLRHELGLLSDKDLVEFNLAAAMGVDPERYELTFHLSSGNCKDRHGIEELDVSGLEPSEIVKMHVEQRK